MSKSAKKLLNDASDQTGWNDNSKLTIACEFIDGLVGGKETFARYVEEAVKDELDES